MAEKAKEFVDKGSEIYQGNLPDGAKEHIDFLIFQTKIKQINYEKIRH